ncbi:hypothetical protein A2U01_0062024 [Trifolium medium]|uniref:Uncharacterized protein n=1 Tax=Trifolium medium TaxID=97028 RepID=A0A392RVX1_9FABA|nr:hypothetical protein [Trifolium medium]
MKNGSLQQESVTAQYEEGFQYALEQVKVIFPNIDEKHLGEPNTLMKIEDWKLVPYTLPKEQ